MTDIDRRATAPEPRRIPADIDQPDRVLAGLTARQLSILAAVGAVLLGAWHVTRPWLPTTGYLLVAGPFGIVAVAVALGRHRDGTNLDIHLLAALRYWLQLRHRTTQPRPPHDDHRHATWAEPDPETGLGVGVPDWVAERAVTTNTGWPPLPGHIGRESRSRRPRPASIGLPVRQIAPTDNQIGVLDLGPHGLSVLAALTPVPFTWTSAAQQQVVLDSFTRLLCAIELPLQIVIRAVELDLRPALHELDADTATLPHPALAAAALDHHDYLTDLHRHQQLMTRQVLLVLRDPTPQPHHRGTTAGVGSGSQRLMRALDDAHAALSPAGIALTPLSVAQAHDVLAASTRPTRPPTSLPESSLNATGDGWDLWDDSEQRTDTSNEMGLADAAGWLPEHIRVEPGHVIVGDTYSASLAIVGYPRQVYPGWLTPLLNHPAQLDVTMHIEPVPTELAARRLRQQLARLESTRALDADHGRLADPRTDTAAADAEDLATRLARGETRLHRLGLYLTVHAPTEQELDQQLHAVRTLASSMLLDARLSTYRALQAWTTTLPIGIDALARRRVMDTDALASTVPVTSMELPAADPVTARPPSGVLYGHNLATGGLVIHDRFAAPNHNAVILASSGAGKSYLAKLELLRSLYRGIEVIVIDPEDEYARLAHQVGGTHLRLGSPGVRINPLDLPHPPQPTDPAFSRGVSGATGPDSPRTGADVLTRRALYMHTVLAVLLGELTSHERVLADRVIHTAYTGAGITADPTTWARPAPVLADLAAAFTGLGDPVATDLAHRLSPFVTGSYRVLFDGPTTVAPHGHLVVFSLKDLPEQLRPIGTLTALDATWRTITDRHTRRPRLVVVDEAWLLLQHATGAEFLLRLAKAARKHWAGLTLITQDAGDLLASDLGRAVISNAATHILLRTAPHAAPRIASEYQLTDAERDFLTTAPTGTGLLLTHTGHHIPFTAEASPQEDLLATTDPAQLAALAMQPSGRAAVDPDAEDAGTAGFPGFAGRAPVGLNDGEADPL